MNRIEGLNGRFWLTEKDASIKTGIGIRHLAIIHPSKLHRIGDIRPDRGDNRYLYLESDVLALAPKPRLQLTPEQEAEGWEIKEQGGMVVKVLDTTRQNHKPTIPEYESIRNAKPGDIILPGILAQNYSLGVATTHSLFIQAMHDGLVEAVFRLRNPRDHNVWTNDLVSLRDQVDYDGAGLPVSGADPRNIVIAFRRL